MDERAIHIDFFMLAAAVLCGIDFWWSRRRGETTPLIQRAANALLRISPSDFLQIVLLVVAVALLFPRDLEPNSSWGHRNYRASNLSHIGRALHNYGQDHGTFPPLHMRDASGKRLHSWRALLLPYVEASAAYKRYRWNEPWDGPNNIAAKGWTIVEFHSPAGFKSQVDFLRRPGLCQYLAVTGLDSCWGTDRINDSVAPTLMVVECPESTIYWSEPRDLANPPTFPPRPRPWYSMRSERSYGRHALYTDASVHFFPDGVPTVHPPRYPPSQPSIRFQNWRWFLAAAELIALGCAAWQSFALLRQSRARVGAVLACAFVVCVAPVLPPFVGVLSPLALAICLLACRRLDALGLIVLATYGWYLLILVPPIHRYFAHTESDVADEVLESFLVLVPIAAVPLLPSLGTNKPRIGFYTLILALACLQPLGQW